MSGPASAWRFITSQTPLPRCGLGWKSLGVLELTALPSIGEQRWVPWVREADVILVAGGDVAYLCHWVRQSGLADLPPSLRDTLNTARQPCNSSLSGRWSRRRQMMAQARVRNIVADLPADAEAWEPVQQGDGLRDDPPSGLRQGARRFRGTFTLHVGSQRGSEGGGEFVIPGTEKATGDDELAGPQGQSFDASSRLQDGCGSYPGTGGPSGDDQAGCLKFLVCARHGAVGKPQIGGELPDRREPLSFRKHS